MDDFDDLLEALMGALDPGNDKLRAKVREGLVEGMRDAGLDGFDFELDTGPSEAGPRVTVLNGGGERTGKRDAPPLEVLDGAEPEDERFAEPEVTVSVIRTESESVSESAVAEGRISVEQSGQPVYVGSTAHCYRLVVTQGSFQVQLDGKDVGILAEGQSVDVEGCIIRVEGTGQGLYARVPHMD